MYGHVERYGGVLRQYRKLLLKICGAVAPNRTTRYFTGSGGLEISTLHSHIGEKMWCYVHTSKQVKYGVDVSDCGNYVNCCKLSK